MAQRTPTILFCSGKRALSQAFGANGNLLGQMARIWDEWESGELDYMIDEYMIT